MNRALDIVVAGTGLVVTSPLLAAAALAVKLDDGGAVGGPPTRRFTLSWPSPARLRPQRPGDPEGLAFFA